MEIQAKYPGNHVNWWNRDKVTRMLRQCPFDQISLSGYAQSVAPVLRNTRYFDKTRPEMSIYVECIK